MQNSVFTDLQNVVNQANTVEQEAITKIESLESEIAILFPNTNPNTVPTPNTSGNNVPTPNTSGNTFPTP